MTDLVNQPFAKSEAQLGDDPSVEAQPDIARDLSNICYLDTQAAVWLAQRDFRRISQSARQQIKSAALLISPLVVLEIEFLFEIGRVVLRAEEVRLLLYADHGVRLCDLDLTSIMRSALNEKWTRDPFDRLIVSHAKANGFSPLISADRLIRQNYPRAVW